VPRWNGRWPWALTLLQTCIVGLLFLAGTAIPSGWVWASFEHVDNRSRGAGWDRPSRDALASVGDCAKAHRPTAAPGPSGAAERNTPGSGRKSLEAVVARQIVHDLRRLFIGDGRSHHLHHLVHFRIPSGALQEG
jgi:hypothetical protein